MILHISSLSKKNIIESSLMPSENITPAIHVKKKFSSYIKIEDREKKHNTTTTNIHANKKHHYIRYTNALYVMTNTQEYQFFNKNLLANTKQNIINNHRSLSSRKQMNMINKNALLSKRDWYTKFTPTIKDPSSIQKPCLQTLKLGDQPVQQKSLLKKIHYSFLHSRYNGQSLIRPISHTNFLYQKIKTTKSTIHLDTTNVPMVQGYCSPKNIYLAQNIIPKAYLLRAHHVTIQKETAPLIAEKNKNNTSTYSAPTQAQQVTKTHSKNIAHVAHHVTIQKETAPLIAEKNKNNTSTYSAPTQAQQVTKTHSKNIAHVAHHVTIQKETAPLIAEKNKNNTSTYSAPTQAGDNIKNNILANIAQHYDTKNTLLFSKNFIKQDSSYLQKQHVFFSPAEQITNFIQDNHKKLTSAGSHSFAITLKPEILGTVHLNIKIKNNKISAIITTEHQKTLENLQQNISMLTGILQKTGFHAHHENIQFNLEQGSQNNQTNHHNQESRQNHNQQKNRTPHYTDSDPADNQEIQDISIIQERLLAYTRMGSVTYK